MSEHCGHHNLTAVTGTSNAMCDDCGAVLIAIECVGPPSGVTEDGGITQDFRVAEPFEDVKRLRMPDGWRFG